MITIQKILSQGSIEKLIRLSATYRASDEIRKSRPRTHSPVDIQEPVIVIERSSSSSRSPSPVRRTRQHEFSSRGREYVEAYPAKGYHSQRRSHRNPPFFDEDVDAEQEAFSFTLSRHRKSLMSRDSTTASISDISEKDSIPTQAPSDGPQVGKILQVLRSQYTGDCTIGGFQSAELRISEDASSGARRGSQPVFRWV